MVQAEDWPQWRGPRRDASWNETGVLSSFPSARLAPKWTAAVGGGFNGPTVSEGKVFVMDRLTEPEEVERVLCFRADDGKPLWTHSYRCRYEVDYPLGPRASVTVREGRAFALGTMGHFHCLDAVSGRILWSKDLAAEYHVRMPIWGLSASPIADGDRVILQIGGEGGGCLVAFDPAGGEEKWRAVEDSASYSSPILIDQAGKRVLVCVTGNHVVGVAPESGEVYWKHPFRPTKMVMHVPSPVIRGDRLFITSFFDGCLMLRLLTDRLGVEELWRRRGINETKTDGLHSTIGTPIFDGSHVYGVDSYGEFRCLNAETGERVWEDLSLVPNVRWGTAHMVRNQDVVWVFNELGELLIGRLSPKGFEELSRAKVIEPTTDMSQRDHKVCWSHPAFAERCLYARNDQELVCVSLTSD
ncbi:MAG: Outer membrane protein assembly factor BamB [bacterium]|nr:Outer membrane protein assembly factor BamB [bacterium]